MDWSVAVSSIWLMNGTTIQSTAVLGNVDASWSIVGTGDFNLDGKSDILWRDTNGNTAIWFMNGMTPSSTSNIGGNLPTRWTVQSTN